MKMDDNSKELTAIGIVIGALTSGTVGAVVGGVIGAVIGELAKKNRRKP